MASKATYLNYDRSAHGIGMNRIEIWDNWRGRVREYLINEGKQKLKDYIFGKSDTNPLEEISKTKNKELEEQDNKLEKLIRTLKNKS